MSRRAGSIDAIRRAISAASGVPVETIGPDEDLIDDLGLDPIELESLGLILEEIFEGISIDPDQLWASALYRTADSLADYCERQADLAAEIEARRQRRRA